MFGTPATSGIFPGLFFAMKPSVRNALVLGCSAVALAGCGGGSDSPPAPTLAAPANFTLQNLADFTWSATPGATRYELYADPDGPGPQPEAKVDEFNPATGTGFRYLDVAPQGFTGSVYSAGTASAMTALLNSSYRLRACDATGCGAFTEPRASDIPNDVSHEFASGRVPLKTSRGLDAHPHLSRDGLTLALRAPGNGTDGAVYVFSRSARAQPWQVQDQVRSGKSNFAQQIDLSADGGTLAVQANEADATRPNIYNGVIYVYQRSGGTWTQQAFFEAPSAPPACPQPCTASLSGPLALSADGNLLAASVGYARPIEVSYVSLGAVATYARTGATWAPRAVIPAAAGFVNSLALSSDGSTLALNEGGLDPRNADELKTTTPFLRVLAQQGDGSWVQQARLPAGIVDMSDITGSLYSAMAFSGDGNTLAVHALNVPGHPTPELDLKPADLSCGALENGWYIGLYSRSGTAWQRQTAISRGLAGKWALATDGNALFYGNALFSRSGSTWACP